VLSGLFAFATSLDQVVPARVVARPNQRTPAHRMFAAISDNISPAIVAAAIRERLS
jgi:ABC-type spermidine/putrescine transport system permease subunit II